MKIYNVINFCLDKENYFFDVLLTDKNDTYDFLLFDDAGLNQDIITLSLATDKMIFKDVDCLVHSRFGQGYVFRVLPVSHFNIENK